MFAGRFSVVTAVTLLLAASLGGACQSTGAGEARGPGGAGSGGAGPGSGGAPGGGGASLGGAGGGGSGPDGGVGGAGGAAPATCEQSPTPLRQTGTTLELPLDLVYQGKPFVYGEPNAVSSILSVLPVNMRFYLSGVELLTASGAAVPVDMVTAAGDLQPYRVFFFNAEDPAMQTLRVRAPAGSYTGLKIALGLNAACNWGEPAGRVFPLSADSQMTWPNLGHLFLRYEAVHTATGTDPDGGVQPQPQPYIPNAIHMGGDIANRVNPADIVFRVAGALSIPASGGPVTKHLRVAMDQVWKGATATVDINPFFASRPEMDAGERLRLTAADLPLFVFGD
jgi:hypothetical protein